jgi:hypothetical protein
MVKITNHHHQDLLVPFFQKKARFVWYNRTAHGGCLQAKHVPLLAGV